MPFVRSENAVALKIHEAFQSSNDQKAFVKAARQFLENPTEQENGSEEVMSKKEADPLPVDIPAVSDLEEQIAGLTVKQEDPVVVMPQTPPRSSLVRPPGMGSPITPPPGNWLSSPPGLNITPAAANPVVSAVQQQVHQATPAAVAPEIPIMANEQVETMPETPTVEEATPQKTKPVYQPKRLWTRVEQQPGRIMANNIPFGHTVSLRPRQELTAQWMLPVKYLKHHAQKFNLSTDEMSLRDALERLTVALVRRGQTENTSSIISKEVVSEERQDFPFQLKGDVVVGSIPFYTPRTPGNVVLRMFFDNDPVYTLATGPTLNVQCSQADVEPTLRFILSNFKKKGSATSISSLVSFNIVLESFRVPPNTRRHAWEGARRATWGCLCESRKGMLC